MTSEIPQGNDIATIKRQNAIRGCRHCLVTREDLSNPSFDVQKHARYHHITTRLLNKLRTMKSKSKRTELAKEMGLALCQPNPLDELNFDRHLQTPQDPAHTLLQNVSKNLIASTIELLNTKGKGYFAQLVTEHRLPYGWSRFQHPIKHLKSYFFSDFGRLMMVGPVLVARLRKEHFVTRELEKTRLRLKLHRLLQVLLEIVRCWVLLARTNAICFSSTVNSYDELNSILEMVAKQLIKV